MTDVEADLYAACGNPNGLDAQTWSSVGYGDGIIGWANSDFYSDWMAIDPNHIWDGESCSEIACCITYYAGNKSVAYVNSKIYLSNYAQGLVALFSAHGRTGSAPTLGAFVWFDYHDGNGISHTGRVVGYDSYNIYTVEGNVGGRVVARTYPLNSPYIALYGYPNYDDQPVPDPPTPPEPPLPGFEFYKPYWRHQRRGRG